MVVPFFLILSKIKTISVNRSLIHRIWTDLYQIHQLIGYIFLLELGYWKRLFSNDWCFKPRFCTVRLHWAHAMNFVMNHAPGAGSMARPVDQQSSALPLRYRCPPQTEQYSVKSEVIMTCWQILYLFDGRRPGICDIDVFMSHHGELCFWTADNNGINGRYGQTAVVKSNW